jgi:amino acid permease
MNDKNSLLNESSIVDSNKEAHLLSPNGPDNDEIYSIEDDELERTCFKRYFGPIGSGSLRGSTVAMASITFGGGCLAFPKAIALSGPIIGLVMFIFISACSYYTLKILLDDGVKTKKMEYNDLLEHAINRKIVVFSDINNIIMIIGVIMSYQFTVYKFATCLGARYFDVEDTRVNQIIIRSICTLCFQIPLSLLKDISKLQYASLVGTFALIYSIFVVICEMPFYLTKFLKNPDYNIDYFPSNPLGYLDSFATLMFGFASHNGIFQVFTELRRPTVIRYHKVLRRSFIIEVILYIAIAFGGYLSTFSETPDVFLERPDLPDFNDIFVQVAKITLFICLHCCMAINFNIMRSSFKYMLFNNNDIPFCKDFIIVVITYIITNVMVFFVSDVTQILGVIGGICTIILCFINPILIHINLSNMPYTHKDNAIALLIMIFVTIFGTAATVKTLVYSFLDK